MGAAAAGVTTRELDSSRNSSLHEEWMSQMNSRFPVPGYEARGRDSPVPSTWVRG